MPATESTEAASTTSTTETATKDMGKEVVRIRESTKMEAAARAAASACERI